MATIIFYILDCGEWESQIRDVIIEKTGEEGVEVEVYDNTHRVVVKGGNATASELRLQLYVKLGLRVDVVCETYAPPKFEFSSDDDCETYAPSKFEFSSDDDDEEEEEEDDDDDEGDHEEDDDDDEEEDDEKEEDDDDEEEEEDDEEDEEEEEDNDDTYVP